MARSVQENYNSTPQKVRGEPPEVTNITLLVAPDALAVMRQETAQYAAENQETGGILIGCWLDSATVVVVAATEAGPLADHQPYTFAIDIDYANNQLQYWASRYPRCDYIGEWHKHPPTLHYPSSGDLFQARQLLADPSYPNRLINPITVVRGERIAVNFYYIDGKLPGFGHLQPRSLSPQDMLELEPQLSQPRTPGAVATAEQPAVKLAQKEVAWWQQPGGLERLEAESSRLEAAGYKVKKSGYYDAGSWEFVVESKRYPGLITHLECYGRYPDQPPRVLCSYNDQELDVASYVVTNWNPSQYWAADVVKDVDDGFSQQRSSGFKLFGILGGVLIFVLLVVLVVVLVLIPQGNNNIKDAQDETSTAVVQAAQNQSNSSLATSGALYTAQAAAANTATAISNEITQGNIQASINAITAIGNATATAANQPEVTKSPSVVETPNAIANANANLTQAAFSRTQTALYNSQTAVAQTQAALAATQTALVAPKPVNNSGSKPAATSTPKPTGTDAYSLVVTSGNKNSSDPIEVDLDSSAISLKATSNYALVVADNHGHRVGIEMPQTQNYDFASISSNGCQTGDVCYVYLADNCEVGVSGVITNQTCNPISDKTKILEQSFDPKARYTITIKKNS